MAVFLSPVHNDTHFKNDGTLASGYKLYTYAAGSTTPLATYTTSDGSVPQANPIILNARGEPDNQIWLTGGLNYKFILKTDLDVQINPVYDNIRGVNDTTTTVDQWISSTSAPTYISATSFSLSGDQTSTFQVGRRVKATTSGGTIYGTISASVFGALTTVTVVNDSGILDSGLSAIAYGILSNTNDSLPSIINTEVQLQVATAFTTTGTGSAYVLTPIPAITTYTNSRFAATLSADPSGSPTINISGLGAKNFKYKDSTGTKQFVTTSQAKSGHQCDLWYDGTDVILLNPLPQNTLTYATSTDVNARTDTTKVVNASSLQGILVLGSQQATTSGTSIDFNSIPSWVRRVTIILNGVSTSGTSQPIIQLGTSGSFETSGYAGSVGQVAAATATTTASSTAGMQLDTTHLAANLLYYRITWTLIDSASNTWVCDFTGSQTGTVLINSGSCGKSLSGVLTRARLTTIGGADTFDAGAANIIWE